MKVNLQKIISLTFAVTVIISILNISVYADDSGNVMSSHDLYVSQLNVYQSWIDGKITATEMNEQIGAITTKYCEDNNMTIDTFSKGVGAKSHAIGKAIGCAIDTYGNTARERVSDWWNDVMTRNNVPTETTTTQTRPIDMYGYGACVRYMQNGLIARGYCNYVVVYEDGNLKFVAPYQEYYEFTNSWSRVNTHTLTWCPDILALYGDVRYSDGSEYPTDDELVVGTIYNFDQMSDKDLEDLFNDFSEEMDRQNPDLSSIEGLLNAIYARLGSLDSDNDNQLLSEILTAIKAIKSTDTDNTELLELLEDIKNALVFNDDENKENYSEQLKKLIENQITRDDFVIDEDLYNNHIEILKERLLGKFSFIYNMKNFVTYCFDEYSNTSESPEFEIDYNGKSYSINFNAFNDFLPTVQWILAAFIYLTYAYHTYRKIPSYINGGDNE